MGAKPEQEQSQSLGAVGARAELTRSSGVLEATPTRDPKWELEGKLPPLKAFLFFRFLSSPFSFFFCSSTEGDNNIAPIAFFFYIIAAQPRRQWQLCCPRFFFFFLHCRRRWQHCCHHLFPFFLLYHNEKGDDSFVVVAFFFAS
jgi:hypothetical protein